MQSKPPPNWLRIAAVIAAAAVVAIAALTNGFTGSDPVPLAPAPLSTPRAAPPPRGLVSRDHVNLADTPTERENGQAPTQRVGDSFPGCETRFNTHNFSSRGGAKIKVLAPHYTVSRNVPGKADVNAVWAFLNTESTRASAHFIIDAEGNCIYAIPISMKAWTEVAGNPFSVSIEFIAMGTEGRLSDAALDRGGSVFAEVARREHVPVQLGDVRNCEPNTPGEADHAMFGACGGGHCDIRPMFGTHTCRQSSEDAQALAPLIAATKRHMRRVTSTDRLTCRKLNAWRRAGRPTGGQWAQNSVRRRRALESRGVRCLASGPVLA